MKLFKLLFFVILSVLGVAAFLAYKDDSEKKQYIRLSKSDNDFY